MTGLPFTGGMTPTFDGSAVGDAAGDVAGDTAGEATGATFGATDTLLVCVGTGDGRIVKNMFGSGIAVTSTLAVAFPKAPTALGVSTAASSPSFGNLKGEVHSPSYISHLYGHMKEGCTPL